MRAPLLQQADGVRLFLSAFFHLVRCIARPPQWHHLSDPPVSQQVPGLGPRLVSELAFSTSHARFAVDPPSTTLPEPALTILCAHAAQTLHPAQIQRVLFHEVLVAPQRWLAASTFATSKRSSWSRARWSVPLAHQLQQLLGQVVFPHFFPVIAKGSHSRFASSAAVQSSQRVLRNRVSTEMRLHTHASIASASSAAVNGGFPSHSRSASTYSVAIGSRRSSGKSDVASCR
jgi:hypothetical protein